MRRSLLTLAAAAVFGLFLMAGDASACHKRKACATPVACEPAPCPAPEPCAPKKKCFGGLKLFGHHKKCHAGPVCETAAAAPCGEVMAPAVYPTGQMAMPSSQG